jgi:EmrB/QacA subfamily drug resistance transporter
MRAKSLPGRNRLGLVLLCTASFIAVADTTIVSIALPSIRQSLGFSPSSLQWVLNGYALTFGGLLLLLGRVGDLYGRRRLFTIGLLLFGVGSLLCGAAWTPESLVAGRFLQGLGAAAFVPASLALLTAMFTEESERSRAIGVYGAMAALGFVVGMVGGGLITEFWGWRWVFFVNIPVVVLTLIPISSALEESRQRDDSRRVDIYGALTVTSGLVLVIYALSIAPERGWFSPTTILAAAIGIVFLVSSVFIESRHQAPLVPLSVITRKPVLIPNVAIAFQSMIGIAWLYLLTLYFQEVLMEGAFSTGMRFAPMTIASLVGAAIGGRLASQVGVRATAAWGLSLVGAGIGTMIVGMWGGASLILLVVLGMVIGEAGFMLSNVSLTIAATSSVGTERGGLAAGLLNTSIQLGSGWGLGIVAAVVSATLPASDRLDPDHYTGALRWGLFTCICFAASGLLLVLLGLPRAGVTHTNSDSSGDGKGELQTIALTRAASQEAYTSTAQSEPSAIREKGARSWPASRWSAGRTSHGS